MASLGETSQRMTAGVAGLRDQMAATAQLLRQTIDEVDLDHLFDGAVQRLNAEIDGLCQMAAEKRRRLSQEAESWVRLLPRMA